MGNVEFGGFYLYVCCGLLGINVVGYVVVIVGLFDCFDDFGVDVSY